jgi:hypothetical protein
VTPSASNAISRRAIPITSDHIVPGCRRSRPPASRYDPVSPGPPHRSRAPGRSGRRPNRRRRRRVPGSSFRPRARPVRYCSLTTMLSMTTSGGIVQTMLRPASWSRPAGESPVRVGTGAPGSRPRFVVERRRAERGVESLFGGSEHAGRSVKRTLQPRQTHNGGAEPVMSRRRPRLSGLVPVMTWRVLPGYGGRHVCMVWAGTGETRLPGLRQAKTAGISRW